ncbi:MAG: hypothetical protein WDO24_25120 [Pseudomonadota bacterium]
MLALTPDLLAVLHPRRLRRDPAPAPFAVRRSARRAGRAPARIMFRHVLPNVASPIIVR